MFGKLIDYFRGTTRLLIASFFISGHVMTWYGKLSTSYIAFMVALLGGAVGHSIKEDIANQRTDKTTTQVETPTVVATQTVETQQSKPHD